MGTISTAATDEGSLRVSVAVSAPTRTRTFASGRAEPHEHEASELDVDFREGHRIRILQRNPRYRQDVRGDAGIECDRAAKIGKADKLIADHDRIPSRNPKPIVGGLEPQQNLSFRNIAADGAARIGCGGF